MQMQIQIRPDDDLRDDVQAHLRDDPRVTADEIAVRADRGTVWLVGTVESPLHVHAAERATEAVTGALIVENRLKPQPPAPTARADATLRAAALQALADAGFPIGEEIDVAASDGRLAVTGRVPSTDARDAAIAAVAVLPGVDSVADELAAPDALEREASR